jgi:hypothetical protein
LPSNGKSQRKDLGFFSFGKKMLQLKASTNLSDVGGKDFIYCVPNIFSKDFKEIKEFIEKADVKSFIAISPMSMMPMCKRSKGALAGSSTKRYMTKERACTCPLHDEAQRERNENYGLYHGIVYKNGMLDQNDKLGFCSIPAMFAAFEKDFGDVIRSENHDAYDQMKKGVEIACDFQRHNLLALEYLTSLRKAYTARKERVVIRNILAAMLSEDSKILFEFEKMTSQEKKRKKRSKSALVEENDSSTASKTKKSKKEKKTKSPDVIEDSDVESGAVPSTTTAAKKAKLQNKKEDHAFEKAVNKELKKIHSKEKEKDKKEDSSQIQTLEEYAELLSEFDQEQDPARLESLRKKLQAIKIKRVTRAIKSADSLVSKTDVKLSKLVAKYLFVVKEETLECDSTMIPSVEDVKSRIATKMITRIVDQVTQESLDKIRGIIVDATNRTSNRIEKEINESFNSVFLEDKAIALKGVFEHTHSEERQHLIKVLLDVDARCDGHSGLREYLVGLPVASSHGVRIKKLAEAWMTKSSLPKFAGNGKSNEELSRFDAEQEDEDESSSSSSSSSSDSD